MSNKPMRPKLYKKAVYCCVDCPNLYSYFSIVEDKYVGECTEKKREVPVMVHPPFPIPDWCPLEYL